MTWTLIASSVPEGADHYEVHDDGRGYFAVSVNGQTPRAFCTAEASALRWVANRERSRARRCGSAREPLELVFANERGERTVMLSTTRGA